MIVDPEIYKTIIKYRFIKLITLPINKIYGGFSEFDDETCIQRHMGFNYPHGWNDDWIFHVLTSYELTGNDELDKKNISDIEIYLVEFLKDVYRDNFVNSRKPDGSIYLRGSNFNNKIGDKITFYVFYEKN